MAGIDLLLQAVGAALEWFDSLMNGSGLMPLYLGMVLIIIISHKLLSPIFFAGSDKARKRPVSEDSSDG